MCDHTARMYAIINPDSEIGPTGCVVAAGVLALIAFGTFVTAVHPRWRGTSKWRGGVARSVFGSGAFAVGLLIMGVAMLVRSLQHQHGPFAGLVLWLFVSGGVLVVIGPAVDLIHSARKR